MPGYDPEEMWQAQASSDLAEYVSHLDASIKKSSEVQQKIEALSYDFTGAEKEPLYHKHISQTYNESVAWNGTSYSAKNEITFVSASFRDLQRANKLPGRGDGLGDEGLIQTCKALKSIKKENRVFRLGGSDFVTTYKGDPVNKNLIEQTINDYEFTGELEGQNLKIVAQEVNMEDILDVLNSYIERNGNRPENDKEAKKLFGRTVVSAMKMVADFNKAKSLAESIKSYTGTDQSEYFNSYVGYLFSKTELNTKEELINASEDKLNIVCMQIAKAKLEKDLGEEDEVLINILANRMEKIALDSREADAKGKFNSTLTESVEEQHDKYTSDTARNLKNAEHYLTGTNIDNVDDVEEFLKLFSELEKVPYLKDEQFFEFIEENVKELQGKETGAKFSVLKALVGQKLKELHLLHEEQKLTVDALTGLGKREAIENDAHLWDDKTKELSVVAIDLGFLKFFNDVGNREVGDLAIRKGGWILEESIRRYTVLHPNVKAKAYRTGGDEFQLYIQTSDTKEILQIIQEVTKEHGNMPGTEDDALRSVPLQLNVGVCTSAHYASINEDSNIPTNFKRRDVISTVASEALNINKKPQRLRYLAELRGVLQDTKEDREFFKRFLEFSGKSLKGEGDTLFTKIWNGEANLEEIPETNDNELVEMIASMLLKTRQVTI